MFGNYDETQTIGQAMSTWNQLFTDLERVANKKKGNKRRKLLKHIKEGKDAWHKYEAMAQIKILDTDEEASDLAERFADMENKLIQEIGRPFGARFVMNTSHRKQLLIQSINAMRSDVEAQEMHEMQRLTSDLFRENLDKPDQYLKDNMLKIHQEYVDDHKKKYGTDHPDIENLLDPEMADRFIAAFREDFPRHPYDKMKSDDQIRSDIVHMSKDARAASKELLEKYARQIVDCPSDYDEDIAMNFIFDLSQMSVEHDLDVPSPEEMEETVRMFFKVMKQDGASTEGFNDLVQNLFQ